MQDNREKLLQSITEALQELNTDALQLIDSCFIQTIKGSERYSINTTEERLEELKAAAAEREKKQEEEKKQLEEIKENRYKLNPTMIMLGNSSYWSYCFPYGKYHSFLHDVIQARPFETTLDAAIDIFSIGMICGIKEQRSRAKRARV